MFRSALAAALRHLHRGRWSAAIAVFGLAIGMCTALLAALFIRSQYSQDHFVPGYADVHVATLAIKTSGRPARHVLGTPAQLAGIMKSSLPEIDSISRLAREQVVLRAGSVGLPSSIYSVDVNLFDTLPLVAAAGDPAMALAKPEQLVMTREEARELFGDDSPLGRALEVELQDGSRHTATVGALIEDIPRDRTQLQSRIFVSALTGWTALAELDRRTEPPTGLSWGEVRTLVRLRPGASPQRMRSGLTRVLQGLPGAAGEVVRRDGHELNLLRIDRVKTNPDMNPGFAGRMAIAATLGVAVLAVAALNFVILLTARSGSRHMEVRVRRFSGAGRGILVGQFLGEILIQVVIAALLAVAITELLLPYVNSVAHADAEFNYWQEPALLMAAMLGAVLLGLAAGIRPAMTLSSRSLSDATHGPQLARGGGGLRYLVTLQFALLAGLVVATGVVTLQHRYATQEALRFDTDQVLLLEASCTMARLTELRRLDGVRDAACSDAELIGDASSTFKAKARDGQLITINLSAIDDRVLALYGISPLVGRPLSVADVDAAAGSGGRRYLINESAVRLLGFESPAAAIGSFTPINGMTEIIGVLPDFSMGSVAKKVQPTAYYASPEEYSRISVWLSGTDLPATMNAIKQVWSRTGGTGWLNSYFHEERVQRMYQAMLREAQTFGVMALVAISLALLGLAGLAASVAQQRTREIGIRKALGASTGDVLRLLLWQFSKPVVWANLLAWPAAGYLMQRWLNGFAYHIDLPLWLFPATTLATVLIALATVSAHALRVARAKPVMALRHE